MAAESRDAQERAMAGSWVATGRVVAASGAAAAQARSVEDRAWLIQRDCSRAACSLYLTREDPYGPQRARLSWTGRA